MIIHEQWFYQYNVYSEIAFRWTNNFVGQLNNEIYKNWYSINIHKTTTKDGNCTCSKEIFFKSVFQIMMHLVKILKLKKRATLPVLWLSLLEPEWTSWWQRCWRPSVVRSACGRRSGTWPRHPSVGNPSYQSD